MISVTTWHRPADRLPSRIRGPFAPSIDHFDIRDAIARQRTDLPIIREHRHLTGDPTMDWCRGRDAYLRARRRAIANLQRLRRRLHETAAGARIFSKDGLQ